MTVRFAELDVPFQCKSVKASNGSATFEGMASVFGHLDSYNDVVEPGAFSDTLAEHAEKNRMPALLWQHWSDEPIGVWREMRETDEGLFVRGELFTDDIPKARQAYKLLKENGLSGLSIGFNILEADEDKEGIRHLHGIDLWEVSVVTFPALDTARVTGVKANSIKTIRDFERAMRSIGYSSRQSKALAAEGFSAVERDVDPANHRDDGHEVVVARMRELAEIFKS